MDNKSLLTYAILKVNSHEHPGDYYNNFVPFVAEVIKCENLDIVTATDIKPLLKSRFSLEIPINVVGTILRKMSKSKYLIYEERVYRANYKYLDRLDFQSQKNAVLDSHEALLKSIKDYALNVHNESFTNETLETMLLEFINLNQISILEQEYSRFSEEESLKIDNSKKKMIIISQFVRSCLIEDNSDKRHLMNLIQGNVLSSALYYTSPSQIDSKFKKTEIFLDTSFVLYALGYSGEARKEPCTELISMLKDMGASVSCFKHNIEEVASILTWCSKNLNSTNADQHGTLRYFRNEGMDEGDIGAIINDLENIVRRRLYINIKETATYEEDQKNDNKFHHIIGHKDLTEYLKENMNYRKERAVDNDVESVAAITRIRKGHRSVHIENSRAIFVTTNFKFARLIKDKFKEDLSTIPPVLHDTIITNLMWIKNPIKAPDLPAKRLIAECYAAMAPKERLWSRYISLLQDCRAAKKIDEHDYKYLIYTPVAQELLLETTYGDENALDIGTPAEILRLTKERYTRERDLKIKEQQQKIDLDRRTLEEWKMDAQNQKTLAMEEQTATAEKFTRGIDKLSSLMSKIAGITLVLIFVIAISYISYRLALKTLPENLLKYKFILTGSVTVITFFGLHIKFKNFFERTIKNSTKSFLEKIFGD